MRGEGTVRERGTKQGDWWPRNQGRTAFRNRELVSKPAKKLSKHIQNVSCPVAAW